MRIGTWNVQYASPKRRDALRARLRDIQADIWVLTETHDDLVPVGCEHVVHALARPKISRAVLDGSRWVSVWSRYPVIRASIGLSDPERTVAALVDLGSEGHLLVYGTVMPWQGDRQRPGWSEHHRIIPMQCKEWLQLQAAYPGVPLCVAGDWNTDMHKAKRYGSMKGIAMLREGLEASLLFCATEPARAGLDLLPILAIDHIALPSQWEEATTIVAAWPPESGLSDHSGLVTSVAVPIPLR